MIPLSKQPKLLSEEGNVGVFEIEAFYPGYGITVGNSLRRVLLSSLEGTAVTQIKIKGVAHEFSTIPDVAEDVVIIMLNIKQLRFISHSDEPQTAILKVKGEKLVTASDIKLPSQIELANGNVPIATLTTKSAELEIEFLIEKGIGYVPSEDRKKTKEEIGTIALDAIFSPVVQVKSEVRSMRVGERTNFDRLTLEIETDGTITPTAALKEAIDIFQKQIEVLAQGVKEMMPEETVKEKKPAAKKKTSTKKTTAKK